MKRVSRRDCWWCLWHPSHDKCDEFHRRSETRSTRSRRRSPWKRKGALVAHRFRLSAMAAAGKRPSIAASEIATAYNAVKAVSGDSGLFTHGLAVALGYFRQLDTLVAANFPALKGLYADLLREIRVCWQAVCVCGLHLSSNGCGQVLGKCSSDIASTAATLNAAFTKHKSTETLKRRLCGSARRFMDGLIRLAGHAKRLAAGAIEALRRARGRRNTKLLEAASGILCVLGVCCGRGGGR